MDPDGDFAERHPVNPVPLRMPGDVRDRRALDAGCGQGYVSRMPAARGARVVGADRRGRTRLNRSSPRRRPTARSRSVARKPGGRDHVPVYARIRVIESERYALAERPGPIPPARTAVVEDEMSAKRPANPLALAVLGLLLEAPTHPHAMATTLRERGMDAAFKLTTGSLYDTVRALARDGWIEAADTERVGSRPARTVYRHTEAGRRHFTEWLDELIREPFQEYPRFLSAVGYLGALGRQRAGQALRERANALRKRIEETDRGYRAAREDHHAPRLFVIEAEYAQAMARAELDWVLGIADEIDAGTLEWPEASADA